MSEERGIRTFFDTYICYFEYRLRIGLYISVTFLFVSLVAFLFIDPGTATYVIAVVNVVVLTGFSLMFGLLSWNCARMDK